MDDFITSSIDQELFQVEDVEGDNACFYRALSNGLAFISNGDTSEKILEEKQFNTLRTTDEFYKADSWGRGGEEQELLARQLQDIACEWIYEQAEEKAPVPDLDVTVGDLVGMIHDLTTEEYLEQYQHFAGDFVIEEEGDGDISLVDNRWGSYVEHLAISECLRVPIVVLNAQKYDVRREKTITGSIRNDKPIRGVRYRVYQTAGMEYMREGKLPVFMLWKKGKTGPHYMAVYPKQMQRCIESIGAVHQGVHQGVRQGGAPPYGAVE